MAFQTSRSSSANSNFNKSPSDAVAVNKVVVSKDTTSINLGGAYEGKPNSKLALKTGKLKEAITIPAGYTIKVFTKGGKSKNGKDLPPFEIVAQPGKVD